MLISTVHLLAVFHTPTCILMDQSLIFPNLKFKTITFSLDLQ